MSTNGKNQKVTTDTQSILREHVIAKSDGEWLDVHTIKDLKTCYRLVDNLPFSEEDKKLIKHYLELAVMCHDVGKAATGFQNSLSIYSSSHPKDGTIGKLPFDGVVKPKWGHRHEILSAAFAVTLGLPSLVVFTILIHHKDLHGEPYGCLNYADLPLFPDEIPHSWTQIVKEFNDNIEALRNDWVGICKFVGREDLIPFQPLTPLSDLGNIDWLIRNKQREKIPFSDRYFASLLRGLLISSDHIASSGIGLPDKIPILKRYTIGKHVKHDFQKKSGNHKGNLMLRAPTGSGKTDAGLGWAQLNQKYNGRLFYVLPTQASINAMYQTIGSKDYFGKENVGLLHSRSGSVLYYLLGENPTSNKIENQNRARTLKSIAREMYYPIRVCTPHQILRYSLQGRGWEQMLSEFPNSCFIFDEVHAYDPTLFGLTMATAKFITKLGGRVMFLSATLPSFLRRMISDEITDSKFIEPDPILDKRILEKKRHEIKIQSGTMLDNIDFIVSEANKHKSTLVVCNYVRTAQQVYNELKKRIDGVVLLHSQFNRIDRNEKENSIMKQLPNILVSTQVVEVSLNIDFDIGFSEPAPLDALVQRMGRINRYGSRTTPSPVTIFGKQVTWKHFKIIYPVPIVDKSLEVLQELSNKQITEEDLNAAAEVVYKDGYTEEQMGNYRAALNNILIRNFETELVAGTHSNYTEIIMDELEGKRDLLPKIYAAKYKDLYDKKLRIEADDLMVPVRERLFGRLIKQGIIDTTNEPWIIDKPYSSEMGLIS